MSEPEVCDLLGIVSESVRSRKASTPSPQKEMAEKTHWSGRALSISCPHLEPASELRTRTCTIKSSEVINLCSVLTGLESEASDGPSFLTTLSECYASAIRYLGLARFRGMKRT